MKGDFSRETFRSGRHYWGVLRQQGRVDLDADWNEQVRIARHQHTTRTVDAVGQAGGPAANAGFGVTVDETGKLVLGAGRYYVSGVLCENDAPVAFAEQPDPGGEETPDGAGVHLLYLDVWDRHVTALDDPLIRETALGGPDTATRARTVWQVRSEPLAELAGELADAVDALATAREEGSDEDVEAALRTLHAVVGQTYCEDPLDPAAGALDPTSGLLAARASEAGSGPEDPCRFTPEGGYERLENRLYRVEIHDPGDASEATYKWSRDNGSVVVAVEEYLVAAGETTTNRIKVRRLGLDELTALAEGHFVELVADDDELAGRPGALVQIRNRPDPAERILELSEQVTPKDLGLHPKVRRWDMPPDGGLADVGLRWAALEDGVEVRFRDGRFHTGDFWVIPARTATADVEWPPHPTYPGESVDAGPADLPPMGVAHHRAPIAALVHDGDEILTAVDLRRLFPAATALRTMRQAGGDGQEPELPGGVLPQPLQVAVANGDEPVAGALVAFEVVAGDGGLEAVDGAGFSETVTVPTGPDGFAAVTWQVDPEQANHRVRAQLLDACGDPVGVALFFNARVNAALASLSGDGQEGLPGETLAPLQVWVSDGRWPVEGARVAFEVRAGGGSLEADTETGPDGVASATWTLGGTTPRQQVTARLLDRTGDLLHEAAVVFNANLSRASEVAYAPAEDCVTLREAGTVQEALDELCRREQGGTCTFAVRPGTDVAALFETIQAAEIDDFALCFGEGTFELAQPLTLSGKGQVRVSGAGRATRLVAAGSEAALRLERCGGVEVHALGVEARAARAGDGLGGALTLVDCGAVTVDGVTAVCGSAPERRAAGITVRRTEPGSASGPVRIRHCDVEVGEQQVGILVVNGERIHVEDNTVRPGRLPERERLADLLANRRYRGAVRRRLVSFAEPVDPAPGDRSQAFTVETRGGTFTLRSEAADGTRRDVWREEIAARNPTSVREAKAAAIAIASTVLRQEGRLGRRRVFREWYEQLEERFAVTGDRGIVVGGTVAEDVRILHNSVHGVLRAVSIGLSDADGAGYHAGVVQVVGNTLLLPGDSVVTSVTEAVFVGNCRSLLVGDNTVSVAVADRGEAALAVDGMRVDGVLGARMIVRANEFRDTVVGVRITPADNGGGDTPRRWLATDNVATTGRMLDAPCSVIEDGNVPPRAQPCPGDRPA